MTSNPLKQNYPSATCQHCGKVTDIQKSHSYRALVTQNKVLKGELKLHIENNHKILLVKNGQIQAMHKAIFQMRELMTSEQLEKAKKISQWLREELKWRKE